jgi:HPt (histidine-containing phosphotransfer) domain-containing protein
MDDVSTGLDEYRQIMGKDDFRNFVIDLIDILYDTSPIYFNQLKDAFREKENISFKRAAHSLKSSALTFGASEFAAIAAELEVRGCLEDPDEIWNLITHCEMEYEKIKSTLEALRQEL